MVQVIATGEVTAGSSATAQFALPSGIQDGDVLLCAVHKESTGAAVPPTNQGYFQLSQDDTTGQSIGIFVAILTDADALTFHTFTLATAVWRMGSFVVLRDVDLTSMLAGGLPAATNGTDQTAETPAISPAVVDNSELMWWVTSWADTTKTFPSTNDGYTVTRRYGGNTTNLGMATAEYTTGSVVSSLVASLSAAPTRWQAKSIPIRTKQTSTPQAPYFAGAGLAVFTATSGANLTVPLPSNWKPNDIHILYAARSDNTTMTALSGWTQLTAVTGNSGLVQRVEVWWRRAVAGDTTPTITFGAGTTVRGAQIIGVRGVDPNATDPFSAAARSANAPSTTVTFPSVTPADPSTFLLALYAYEDDPSAIAVSSSFSVPTVAPSSLGNDMALGYFTTSIASSGSPTGVFTGTVSGGTFAASNNIGIVLLLKPVPVSTSVTDTGAMALGVGGFSGTGAYVAPPVDGTGALSVRVPALSGAGQLAYAGLGGMSVRVPALSGTGLLAYTGVGGTSVRVPSFAGSGLLAYAGVGTLRIGVPSLSGAGGFVPSTGGVGGISIGVPDLDGLGTLLYGGNGGLVVSVPAMGGSGLLAYSAQGGVTIGVPVFVGEGDFIPVGEGNGGISIDVGSFSGVGYLAYAGVGGIAVRVASFAGTGILAYVASGGITISRPLFGGSGLSIDQIVGMGAVSVAVPSFGGVGTYGLAGSGAIDIGVPTFVGSGLLLYAGLGGIIVSVPSFEGAAIYRPEDIIGDGGIVIGNVSFSGDGSFISAPISGMGGMTIGVPLLSGIGLVVGLMPSIVGTPFAVGARRGSTAVAASANSRAVFVGRTIDSRVVTEGGSQVKWSKQ